jgi:hypothetical protein
MIASLARTLTSLAALFLTCCAVDLLLHAAENLGAVGNLP